MLLPDKELLRLFPGPTASVPLKGLYLREGLHLRGDPEKPFVYANFLSSLDGRIAVEDDSGRMGLPSSLTNPWDFRLFLELHAQADCLITHSGYIRALSQGILGNILKVGNHPIGQDLNDWRRTVGLPAQPAVVIVSESLDFPDPRPWLTPDQVCLLATGDQTEDARVAAWQNRSIEIIRAGRSRRVTGQRLISELAQRGYRSIYLIAGPEILDTMIRDRQLSLLYQTLRHRLLGGEEFRTLIPGPLLTASGNLRLTGLFHDEDAGDQVGQWFAKFQLES